MTRRGVGATLTLLSVLLAGGCIFGGDGDSDGDSIGDSIGDTKETSGFVPTLEDTVCPRQVDDVLAERYSCQLLTVRPEGGGRPAIRPVGDQGGA